MLHNWKGNLIAAFLVTATAIPFASPSFANDPFLISERMEGICTTSSPNGGRINIRSGPGKTFRVVGTVASRARINVEGSTQDAEGTFWYEVRVGRINGWVLGSFITCVDGL
jgi:hypothetical protein